MGAPVETLMVVPARGGSRSIPRKNVKPIAGRPLIAWVLEAGIGCDAIDRIVVSTDDDEIAAVVAREAPHPKVACFARSAATATDGASSELALREVAEAVPSATLVLAQATSPLLRAADLAGGLELMRARGADSVVSVVRQKRFLWQVDGDGLARPLNYDPASRPMRQAFDGVLVENGAFYACDRDGFLRAGVRLFGRTVAYEMPPETYVELDEPADWLVVEALLRARGRGAAVPGDLRLVLSDIDGVLTDAGMYYAEGGDELKKFNTYDGLAVALLREAGIKVGLITRESRELNARRAAKIGVDMIAQGATDKVAVADGWRRELGLSWSQIAYLGDDVHDIALLDRAGFSAAPAGAVAEVRARVDHVCARAGGEGCLREVAELVLAAAAGGRA